MPLLRAPCFTISVRCLAAIAVVLSLSHPTCLAQSTILVGVGSTVPLPMYTKWSEMYNKRNPKFQMRYLGHGTAEGIKEVASGNGDFGAGEVPLESKDHAGKPLTQLPTALIGIVPIYNLPGSSRELRFTGELLARIFLGQVKTWNSSAIETLNPGLSLPDLPIKVIYRPAGKGSNYVFSEFLSKSSHQFKTEIGVDSSPKWPVGSPAERSADMVEKVKSESGAIGYVELQYAVAQQVAHGLVQNRSGAFVKASNKTITAACEVVESPDWRRFSASLTNAPGADSYPITSFTWIYLPTGLKDPSRAGAMTDFLNWAFGEGQTTAAELGYSPLPPRLLQAVQAKVSAIH